jgi:hypothetical protein
LAWERENIFYGEDYSRAEHELFTSSEKYSPGGGDGRGGGGVLQRFLPLSLDAERAAVD